MNNFISDLEACLENLSDNEMQQISGGTTVTSDVYPSEARNKRPRDRGQDIGVGASASISDRFPLAATYVTSRG